MAGPALVAPLVNRVVESASSTTGFLSSLNTQSATTALSNTPTPGLGLGAGLSSLLLPGNLSPSMKSIFAAAIELPIITALVSPSWTRNAFYSTGGIAAGIYAGILLSQSGQSSRSS